MKNPLDTRRTQHNFQIVSALLTLAAGGIMGTMVRNIDGVNYAVGAYGIGLMLGTMFNVIVTIWLGFNSNKR